MAADCQEGSLRASAEVEEREGERLSWRVGGSG